MNSYISKSMSSAFVIALIGFFSGSANAAVAADFYGTSSYRTLGEALALAQGNALALARARGFYNCTFVGYQSRSTFPGVPSPVTVTAAYTCTK
ncbi:hypothetical protein [Xanthomonas arboricola]|uniref:hypothetical protein n=1 Tax=Xanthomonas arboricola TaxID=56448 RepID=UPI002B2C82B6|nr:hypothetical protein X12_003573 [Xanthomonas arboricola]